MIQDSIQMVALDVSYEADRSILIDFCKPVNLRSVTSKNIYVVATSTITGTVIAAPIAHDWFSIREVRSATCRSC